MLGKALVLTLFLGFSAASFADETADEARGVLEKYCVRCHQGEKSKGGDGDFLNVADMIKRELVKPGDLAGSEVLQRMLNEEMPPTGESVRPGIADAKILIDWIEAGTPEFPKDVSVRAPIRLESVLTAVRDHLADLKKKNFPTSSIRFFTLHTYANNPNVRDSDLRLARAAFSKVLNSVSLADEIIVPESLDPEGTVFAVDISQLAWRPDAWMEIERQYPYGVNASDGLVRSKLEAEIAEMTVGCSLPLIRADWFVATASRPPLYHILLDLPSHAGDLERELGVDIVGAFLGKPGCKMARAGFTKSGVSAQNRMFEWVMTKDRRRYYYKSIDFKPTNGRSNLARFPLGPLNLFPEGRHPHPTQAFVHDGGEIIFGLKNRLQAYLLVNGKDERIDTGPIDVVADALETAGTREIVNGLSCMGCHRNGLLPAADEVRNNNALFDALKPEVDRLFVEKAEMDALLERDSQSFQTALEKAVGPFLRTDKNKDVPTADLPEPVSPVANRFRVGYLDLAAVGRELDLDPDVIEKKLGLNGLKRLGLDGLLKKSFVSRIEWESKLDDVSFRVKGPSLMQQLAFELGLTPIVTE